MTYHLPITAAIAIAVLFKGATASADVTAPEVWANLKTWIERGPNVIDSGTQQMLGDTLTINDISITYDIAGTEFRLDYPSLTLRELGDGTVGIFPPDTFGLSVTSDEGILSSVLTIDHSDLSIIADSNQGIITYDVTATDLSLDATAFDVDGQPVNGNIGVTLSDYVGTYSTSTDSGLFSAAGNDRVASAEIAVNLDFPENWGNFDLVVNADEYSRIFSKSLPEELDQENITKAISDGLITEHTDAIGNLEATLLFRDKDSVFDAKVSAGEVAVGVALDKTGLNTSQSARNLMVSSTMHQRATVTGTEIDLGMAEFDLEFLMPASPSDEPEDFSLDLRLVDLDLPEHLWNQFDPAGVLPRDPATLAFDISGKGKWLIDALDEASWEEWLDADAPLGELHHLVLHGLRLSATGAELTGEGEFAFDNSNLDAFEGMPRPEGTISLKLTGGNELLDKLVEMNLVPEAQATAARMTMGIFAAPGPGEDELNSMIEIDAEGNVFANGQRLR